MADEVQVTGSPGETTEADKPSQSGLTAAIALIAERPCQGLLLAW